MEQEPNNTSLKLFREMLNDNLTVSDTLVLDKLRMEKFVIPSETLVASLKFLFDKNNTGFIESTKLIENFVTHCDLELGWVKCIFQEIRIYKERNYTDVLSKDEIDTLFDSFSTKTGVQEKFISITELVEEIQKRNV